MLQGFYIIILFINSKTKVLHFPEMLGKYFNKKVAYNLFSYS